MKQNKTCQKHKGKGKITKKQKEKCPLMHWGQTKGLSEVCVSLMQYFKQTASSGQIDINLECREESFSQLQSIKMCSQLVCKEKKPNVDQAANISHLQLEIFPSLTTFKLLGDSATLFPSSPLIMSTTSSSVAIRRALFPF